MFKSYHRDEVFVAGGQPTVTYVQRDEQHVERNLARAIATPNLIVSLSGPTKTGKTVLCRKVLGKREYVWIDGGQVSSAEDFWKRVTVELDIPAETTVAIAHQTSGKFEGKVPLVVTAGGSQLYQKTTTEKRTPHSMAEAIGILLSDKIVLVIDDFHYIDAESRTEIMRNVKGAVFNGLKVLLLSVTHRAFDAIKAENELTGRFTTITLPSWSNDDLKQIAALGFQALNFKCPQNIVDRLAAESQESPFLMQRFCWEICFDMGIESTILLGAFGKKEVPENYNLEPMFIRLAEDAGLPIYRQLSAGPQSRKMRAKRPLRNGSEADIYEATLLALAETGPKSAVKYDELRAALSTLLKDMVPQKHEITSALKHLATISRKAGSESAIDWDDDNRVVNVADPYLRFYLRWRVRNRDGDPNEPQLFH